MKFLVLALLATPSALAMNCDSDYSCTSASGKYKIEIQRCRYDNALGNILTLEIDRKAVTGGQLGPAFDGDDFAGFEIDLPDQGDNQRMLSVEWSQKTGKGLIRDKARNFNPAPYKTTHQEAITCVQDEG